MKMKRIISFVLLGCMAAGLLTGCSSENTAKEEKEEIDSKNGMGKYQEEEVAVPLKENETILQLCKSPEGALVIYVENRVEEKFCKYESKDGREWKTEEAPWLAAYPNEMIGRIAVGQDGSEYAIVVTAGKDEKEVRIHLLKKTESGETVEIDIPDLNKKDEAFLWVNAELMVLENGKLVLAGNEDVRVYDAAGGNKRYAFQLQRGRENSSAASKLVSVNGNKIIMPDQNGKGFVVKNGETEETAISYGANVLGGRVILGKENDVYFLDAKGIHHMQAGGSLVETLVDGSNRMMGMPSSEIKDFVIGSDKDFYVLYSNDDNQKSVKHYFYDTQAEVVSRKKLNIYSLKENKTVRQAVSEFNQKYPDVEVSYKTGESEGATTRADQIRVLNTELLNENGADVLILDELPIESFMEKGILQDISGVLEPLINDGTMQKNIAEYYQDENGKIYSMPVKYGVPILYGSQSWIDAIQTMESLEQWLEKHPDTPFMEYMPYERFTKLLISMYYEELFGEDGKLKEEAMKQCLSIVEKAEEQIQGEMTDVSGYSEGSSIGFWDGGLSEPLFEEGKGASREITGADSMVHPYTAMREQDLRPVCNKDMFVPHIIVGINSKAKEQELAEEFVRILFSEEVQKQDFSEGLPMNVKAAEKIIAEGADKTEKQAEIRKRLNDQDLDMVHLSPTSKDERKYLFDMADKLKKPAEADSLLLDMIFEEAKLYYEGSKNLEEAVQGIIAKVDTYRAE